eukprot:2508642-Amphidinium_carterae.1
MEVGAHLHYEADDQLDVIESSYLCPKTSEPQVIRPTVVFHRQLHNCCENHKSQPSIKSGMQSSSQARERYTPQR